MPNLIKQLVIAKRTQTPVAPRVYCLSSVSKGVTGHAFQLEQAGLK